MNSASPVSTYRPDIDFLRAVAICAVLMFHLDPNWLPGGFLGVDVFFVISGYLITGNIRHAIAADRWSFSQFYTSRILRLFPALAAATALSLIAGLFILSPVHLSELATSAGASVFWFSNFLFWSQSGYFDTAALFKPLLHTWSLAVEEQFYLVWPVLLWLTFQRRGSAGMVWVIVGALIASLAAAIFASRAQPDAAFFLMPFRTFEFASGALALFLRPRLLSIRMSSIAAIVGVALIIFSCVFLGELAQVPGVWSLLPCLGTCLALHAADRGDLSARWLQFTPMVWVGRISYSLYLVHWPVVVLGTYSLSSAPNPLQIVGFGLGSFVFGAALYHGVERPFQLLRKSGEWTVRRTLTQSTWIAAVVSVAGLAAVFAGGLPWRYPEAQQRYAEFDVGQERRQTWELVSRFDRARFGEGPIDILVVGDSHAKDMFNAIAFNRAALETTHGPLALSAFVTNRQCERGDDPDQECNTAYIPLFDLGLHARAKTIVFNQSWSRGELAALPEVIRRIRNESNARIVVIENSVRFSDVPSTVLKNIGWGNPNDWMWSQRNTSYVDVNERLRELLSEADLEPVPMEPIMCPQEICAVLDREGELLFYDAGHWTVEGAAEFGRRMLEAGLFDQMLR